MWIAWRGHQILAFENIFKKVLLNLDKDIAFYNNSLYHTVKCGCKTTSTKLTRKSYTDGNFPIYNMYKKSSTELQKTCKLPSTKKIPQLREKVLYFYIIQKYPANKVFNNEHIMKIYYSESISFHKYYPLEPETQVLMLKY